MAQESQLTSIAFGLQVLVNPLKDTELIFYGGEYYNGDKVSIMGTMPMLISQAIFCLASGTLSLDKIRLQPDLCQGHFGKDCCGCCRILKGFGSDICLW